MLKNGVPKEGRVLQATHFNQLALILSKYFHINKHLKSNIKKTALQFCRAVLILLLIRHYKRKRISVKSITIS